MLIKKINPQNNFIYLTLALIALLVSSSILPLLENRLIDSLFMGFVTLTLGVCLFSLRFDPQWFRFLLLLLVLWLALNVAHLVVSTLPLEPWMLALNFVFFLSTFKSIAKQILFTDQVTANQIVGSVALFLLLGLVWAFAYLIILQFIPEAFAGIKSQSWVNNFSHIAYFSFVTLTTLGYGDISPITPLSQVLTYLEAIAGLFYMAIVVSSLVSAHIAHKGTQNA